jgi:hypothetical protein
VKRGGGYEQDRNRFEREQRLATYTGEDEVISASELKKRLAQGTESLYGPHTLSCLLLTG